MLVTEYIAIVELAKREIVTEKANVDDAISENKPQLIGALFQSNCGKKADPQ